MGCRDEETLDFIDSGVNLLDKNMKSGWHHIGMVVSYKEEEQQQYVTFYLDGRHIKDNHPCKMTQKVGFIGNTKEGTRPFGPVADLRIYPRALSSTKIKQMHSLDPLTENYMPDRYILDFL